MNDLSTAPTQRPVKQNGTFFFSKKYIHATLSLQITNQVQIYQYLFSR